MMVVCGVDQINRSAKLRLTFSSEHISSLAITCRRIVRRQMNTVQAASFILFLSLLVNFKSSLLTGLLSANQSGINLLS